MADERIKDLAVKTASPASDDYLPIDGATSSTRGMAVNDLAAYAGATRAMRSHFWSDGATSNRALVQTPGVRGNLAGAAAASWVGWVEVPASNPAATTYVAGLMGTATPPGTQFNSLEIGIYTAGNLNIAISGPTSRSNNRYIDWPSFRATYSGQRIWLEVRFTFGATAPVVRVNGTNVSGSFNVFSTGSATDWLAANLDCTYQLTGYNWPAGIAPQGCWINGHLTDAESESWRITGRPPAWVVSGGSRVNKFINISRNADFSALATDWYTLGTATASAASGALACTTAADADRVVIDANFTNEVNPIFPVGRRYRISGTISGFAATGSAVLVFRQGGTGTPTYAMPQANGAFTIEWVSAASGIGSQSLQFRQVNSGTLAFTVDNIFFEDLGALSLLRPQAIPAADDWTTLGGNPARVVGMVGITDDPTWRISAETTTNGNQQLLGGSVLDSTRDVIDLIEQTTTGTPTTSIGSASGGAQYKASGALTAGINPTTLVTRKLASNDVWVASNSTATVRTTITGHRAA